ncbi:MAG: hypothetical protein AB7I24_07920 [Candidatus Nanopelagicales bacterium]
MAGTSSTASTAPARRRTWWTVGALVAVVVAVVVGAGVATNWFDGRIGALGDGASTESGVIVRFDGRDYWVSDYHLADSALGAPIAQDQPFQGTTADLRAIEGQDPAVTMAAYLPALSQASPEPGWRLVSIDAGYWTDQANVAANSSLFDPQP